MQGLGNDFVLINNLKLQYQFSKAEIAWIADRKLGVGCDQLLLVNPATDGISDFFYTIYNHDGSAAQQCGNGARCFMRYVLAEGLSHKTQLRFQTLAEPIYGLYLAADLYQITLAPAKFDPAIIPFLAPAPALYYQEGGLSFAALSLGNPHAVIEVKHKEDLSQDQKLLSMAILLQQSARFPQGVNVNFVYYATPSVLYLRTYERGCGFTAACGSGASASAVIAVREGRATTTLQVIMPGGALTIQVQDDNIIMRGPATLVFTGEFTLCVS